jgi:hypothetical protein
VIKSLFDHLFRVCSLDDGNDRFRLVHQLSAFAGSSFSVAVTACGEPDPASLERAQATGTLDCVIIRPA